MHSVLLVSFYGGWHPVLLH
uniref:Uncharacterized protein n=1 Tax=Anguilla anguilla TaxID=7936 RepID=A0A0E9XRJ9_ANGAN